MLSPKLASGEITSKEYCDQYIAAGYGREVTLDDYYADKENADRIIAETNAQLACQSERLS